MAKGSGLLLVGVGAAALAALALSSSTTATSAPVTPVGGCTLDANITPAYATAVNQILALPVGAVPATTITALATQLKVAGFPLAAACLNARVAAASAGGVMPGTLPTNCMLDANMPPAMAQTMNALLAASYPAATFTMLAQQFQAKGYPLAAACLNAKAANAAQTLAQALTPFDAYMKQALDPNSAWNQAANHLAAQNGTTPDIAAQQMTQSFYNNLIAVGATAAQATAISTNAIFQNQYTLAGQTPAAAAIALGSAVSTAAAQGV